jgi:asparagine synthase (glutamine-hydrolysing)
MEFAASLPVTLKISNGDSKYLLKKYFKGMLPDHILARPKMGFGVPIKHWFRNQLSGYLEDVLLSPAATGRGYFQPKIVEKLIRRHRSGFYDYSYQLYALLVLELWHREVA